MQALGVDEAKSLFPELGHVRPIWELSAQRAPLTSKQMVSILEEATRLLASFYVHLPLKRTLYGADPQTRLRVLGSLMEETKVAEDDFHEELTSIFTSLRDIHTIYILPQPYRSHVAFLPFLIERCRDDDGTERYLLTKVARGLENRPFAPRTPAHRRREVEVTHWNGIPMPRAVDRAGELNGGGNRAARRARGLERLTFRWLGLGVRPDEDWVVLTYKIGRREHQARFPWLVAERRRRAEGGPTPASRTRRAEGPEMPGGPLATTKVARDEEGDWIRRIKRDLFAPERRRKLTGPAALLRSRVLPGGYGYLRIYSFAVEDGEVEEFVDLVRRELERAPSNGLLIDIRGNPGGDLGAAEQLLQLISPVPIEPEGLQFINTPEASKLADVFLLGEQQRLRSVNGDILQRFGAQLTEMRGTGAPYLASPPVEPPGVYNAIGQVYQGPVALLVDALTYSAGDVFAAGFQDHGLGMVLSADSQTGGGGGNPWTRRDINAITRQPLRRLARGATFEITVRRLTRVRDRAGLGLEDLGVVAKRPRLPITSADVLGENEELIAKAIAQMRKDDPPRYRLRATYDERSRAFAVVEAEGVDRVDVFADGRPLASVRRFDAAIQVPRDDPAPTAAEFLGYSSGNDHPASRPVVSFRWPARA